jgi:hypothetical protein
MCPITHESKLALLIAVAASFIFGYLWYGPLFGKTWAGLMGFKMTEECKGKPPLRSLLLTFLGTALTTFALAYILGNYKPACNFGAALLVWLGFYVPLLFSAVAWESRPWTLFALNAAFYLLNLQLIAGILTYIR